MAFVFAGIVFLLTLVVALAGEFARGMAAAPSMQPSYFLTTLAVGLPIAALIAASHWLPRVGW